MGELGTEGVDDAVHEGQMCLDVGLWGAEADDLLWNDLFWFAHFFFIFYFDVFMTF